MARIDLPAINVGRSVVMRLEGRLILVSRSTQGWRASDAVCPHQRRIMDGARVIGPDVICPWHGARFSLVDGRCGSPELTTNPLRLYPCEEVSGGLVITLD